MRAASVPGSLLAPLLAATALLAGCGRDAPPPPSPQPTGDEARALGDAAAMIRDHPAPVATPPQTEPQHAPAPTR